LNGLALCAGVGGLERGIEFIIPSARTVCYVEGETYPASVLASKMEAGSLPKAPIWSNVRTFDGEAWRGKVSFISGGFPCQPYSKAGKQLADKDPRDLWPDFARIIGEVRPHFIFLENVPNVIKWALPTVLKDLSQMGYDAAWCVVAASQVGANHKRARWFLFAYSNHTNKSIMPLHASQSGTQEFKGIDMAHTNSQSYSQPQRTGEELRQKGSRLEGGKNERETWHIVRGSRQKIPDSQRIRGGQNNRFRKSNESNQDGQTRNFGEWWKVEPGMGRMVDGVADWVHRMRACGNGVVPQQAAYAYSILMERCGFMVSKP